MKGQNIDEKFRRDITNGKTNLSVREIEIPDESDPSETNDQQLDSLYGQNFVLQEVHHSVNDHIVYTESIRSTEDDCYVFLRNRCYGNDHGGRKATSGVDSLAQVL
jgi:hypothetical protein